MNQGIVEIKFEPEKYWLYRPKAWLAERLWRLAYKVHPYPPKFHEEIANRHLEAKKWAQEMVKNIEQMMYESVGIKHPPTGADE